MSAKTECIKLRLEPELRAAIEAAAAADRQPTLSNWVRLALSDQLKSRPARHMMPPGGDRAGA
jgi:uncharacterized protein (DUF1778 family)